MTPPIDIAEYRKWCDEQDEAAEAAKHNRQSVAADVLLRRNATYIRALCDEVERLRAEVERKTIKRITKAITPIPLPEDE